MFQTPARKAKETAKPVRISGTARTIVMVNAVGLPTEPLTSAAPAWRGSKPPSHNDPAATSVVASKATTAATTGPGRFIPCRPA